MYTFFPPYTQSVTLSFLRPFSSLVVTVHVRSFRKVSSVDPWSESLDILQLSTSVSPSCKVGFYSFLYLPLFILVYPRSFRLLIPPGCMGPVSCSVHFTTWLPLGGWSRVLWQTLTHSISNFSDSVRLQRFGKNSLKILFWESVGYLFNFVLE